MGKKKRKKFSWEAPKACYDGWHYFRQAVKRSSFGLRKVTSSHARTTALHATTVTRHDCTVIRLAGVTYNL